MDDSGPSAATPHRASAERAPRWRSILRSLSHRNFRLYFAGQGISLIGTWMQQTAMTWLVYRLSDRALILGILGFAAQLPVFFLSPLAGVLSDRWNRHRVLLATQSLAMAQAFTLALLDWAGWIDVWVIVGLSTMLGLVNAFDMTTRQAFMREMIDRPEDLGNAIALNSSVFNGARLVGPALGGLFVAAVGEATCFFLNGFSFLAVLAALLAMRLTPRRGAAAPPQVWQGLREGFAYAFGFPPIRSILLLLALVSLTGLSYEVLMPVLARELLHGGPATYGFLMTAAGSGALVGAIYLASRRTILGLGLRLALAPLGFGLGLIALSFSQYLGLSLLLLAGMGFAVMVHLASSNTILQTISDDDKRGRVMSLYTMSFIGVAPFGSLLAGGLAGALGVRHTLVLGGIASVVGSLVFVRKLRSIRELIRPIYRKIGILPEISEGVQAASTLRAPPEH